MNLTAPSSSRIALVTGGSRGIGRGIVLELARAGYGVAVNYVRNREAAESVCADLARLGVPAMSVPGNVGERDDRERLVDAVLARFGRIDLLVNNAGVAPKERADILEATEDSWDDVLGTNLKGPYFLTQRVALAMIRLLEEEVIESGKIVFISSISANTSSVNRGDYCISKAGLHMATLLYAHRLAEHGINVYEIQPGIIETDMTGPVKAKYDKLIAEGLQPIARWGKPEDVGKAVAAIALGYLDFTTGETIEIGGGFGLKRL